MENPVPVDNPTGGPTGYPAETGVPVAGVMTSDKAKEDFSNGTFEPNPKHGLTQKGKANPEPTNPQEALNNSIEMPGNTTRRIAVDKEAEEFVVFDEHMPGKFHGHTRSWNELDQSMQATLRKEKLVTKKGKIK